MSEDRKIADTLIPRKEKHKKMIDQDQIPHSNDQRLIIPCLERSFGFKTNQYPKNINILSPLIDRPTFNSFVRAANKIIDHQLYEKAQNQTEPFFNIISFLLKLSIVIGIMTFTVLSVAVYMDISENVSQIILIVSIILIVFSIAIAVLCPIVLYRSKYIERNYEEMIKQKLEKLTEEENTKLRHSEKGYISWKFGQDFFWLELHINHQLYHNHQEGNILFFQRGEETQ